MIIVAVTSIISFIVGWGLSVINDRRNRIHIAASAIKSIIAELKAMKKAVDEGIIKPPLEISLPDASGNYGIKVSYHVFHTASYDSLPYSGSFRELDPETQRKIADVYEHIKTYNRSRMRLQKIIIAPAGVSTNFIENIRQYGNTVETILKENITKIEELITTLERK
jgi:hypothetical protein